jgi:protein-S-isoprenylcysteine O-methyltransferase Ste14
MQNPAPRDCDVVPNTTLYRTTLRTNEQTVAAWIVRRRVRITSIVFATLLTASVLKGNRPHDLTNLHETKSVVGLGLILAGLAIRSWAAGILHKGSQLTTVGPYAIIRNPLYLGSFMMMVGFGTLIDQWQIWIALTPFLVLFVYAVKAEERLLAERFGQAWIDYEKCTPRFIPRRLYAPNAGRWEFQQWVGNREYQAVSAAAIGLLALKAWQLT